MAVAHDAATESHTGVVGSASEASFTWEHDPVGTPRGVLIYVVNLSAATNIVSSVTYEGVTVPLVSGGEAASGASEPGHCAAFFLGVSVPTADTATVVINRTNNTNELWAVCITQTAAADTEPFGVAVLAGTGTLTEQNVDDGSPGTNSVRYAGTYTSSNNVPGVGVSSTLLLDFDTGGQAGGTVRETTAGQGSRPIGFAVANNERAAVHLAVREAAGGTPATVTPAVIAVTAALPTPAVLAASTVTPTVIAAAAALSTPAALAAAKVTPTVIAVTAALPTPTVLAAAKVTPTVIAAVAALPTPTVLAASKVTPTVIAATVTLPPPTIVVASTVVSPAVIAATVSLPTPTVIVPALVTPTTIAATAALPTPTVLAAALVAPAVIPVTVTLPTPTIVGPAAVVTPATIAATVSLPTPTILAAALVTPTTIAVVVGLPTPTVIGETTVMPATILVTVTFPGPTVILGAIKFWTVNPAAYAANPAGYDPIVGDDTPPLW